MASGTHDMSGSEQIDGSHPVHRITRLAESIDVPAHRRRVRTGAAGVGPTLVAGLGLGQRHPRSRLSSFLWGTMYALLGAGATFLAYWIFLR